MRTRFEHLYAHPPLVTTVIDPQPADALRTIQRAIAQGTDGFIFQLERMDPAQKNKANLTHLFAAAEGFPIMVTNYPHESNADQSDEERLALELEALEAGAACLDLRADIYDRGAKHEITLNPDAVAKQKAAIQRIHQRGGQVILSMHVWEYLDTETVLRYGHELERRGADIVKIVHTVGDTAELAQCFQTTEALHRAVSVPVLHLLNGPCCELHRLYGTAFGSCLAFCVQEYIAGSSASQPLLTKMAELRKHSPYIYYKKEEK